MNTNLLLKTFKEIRVSWLSYATGLALYAYFIVWFFPTIIENTADFIKLLENYPEAIFTVFGGGAADFTTIEGFLALEFFGLMWFIIAGAFVISFGTGVIAKEIESGTIEILLSQPITRTAALITKSMVLFAGTTGLVAATMLVTYISAIAVGVEIKTAGLLALGLIGGLFFLSIAAYSLFFSIALGERGKAAFLSAGILTAMYLLNVLAQYSERLETLSAISLFKYYNAATLLSTGDIPLRSLLVFGGVTIGAYVAAILVFNRRDIAP